MNERGLSNVTGLSKLSDLTKDLRKATATTVKEAAGAGSVHSHIMMALGDVAEEMGKFLGAKYKEGFTGFSSKAYNAGYMSMGVSSEIKNQKEPSRKGDCGIEVKWDPRQGEYPTIRVWAVFPKAPNQFSREIAFKLGEAPASAVKRIGPAFVRDLDYWIAGVTKAYETRVAELSGGKLKCDMREGCKNPVTHIGEKGYVYCASHAPDRRGYENTRKLRPAEIKKLEAGETIRYRR